MSSFAINGPPTLSYARSDTISFGSPSARASCNLSASNSFASTQPSSSQAASLSILIRTVLLLEDSRGKMPERSAPALLDKREPEHCFAVADLNKPSFIIVGFDDLMDETCARGYRPAAFPGDKKPKDEKLESIDRGDSSDGESRDSGTSPSEFQNLSSLNGESDAKLECMRVDSLAVPSAIVFKSIIDASIPRLASSLSSKSSATWHDHDRIAVNKG
mmetsp:Transcript_62242/g.184094  ORF Transcript_62242/g.184094 Transcript_62242/m.184094 type:complete len:218 (-) Transcript_62242:2208-2861(-)